MKNKSKNIFKRFLAALMVCALAMVPITPSEASENEPVSYTVEFNNVTDGFFCNATPSDGPVYLKYTVESASTGVGNNGMVATTIPTAQYPYVGSQGAMKFNASVNQVLQEGETYSIEMKVYPDGTYKTLFTFNEEETTASTAWAGWSGNGSLDSKYFGIYVAPTTTAKLVNVTCVDAEGNDLGLQANNAGIKITKNVQEEPEDTTASYTVEFNNVTDGFFCNATPSDGPVYLKYTVESASTGTGNNGMVATTIPTAQYPYVGTQGAMKYNASVNQVLQEGETYSIEMKVYPDGTYKTLFTFNEEETTASTAWAGWSGNGSLDSKYFGIYVAPTTTAKLVNVTCVDAEGNDLGLQANSSNIRIRRTGEVIPVGVSFETVQPTITDSIALTYKVQVVGSLPEGTLPTMTFEMDDVVSDAVVGSLVAETTDIYTFTYSNIMAQQMADVITATVTVDEVIETNEYSVLQYCQAVLGKTAAELEMTDAKKDALDTMVVDLVKYGAAVQQYREEEVTLTDALTDTQLALGTQSGNLENLVGVIAQDAKLTGTKSNDYAWKSVSVVLREKTNIRCKFVATDIENLTVKITMNGTEIMTNAADFVATGNENEYYVYFDNIYAYEYGEAITFTFVNGNESVGQTLNYSVNTYLDAKKTSKDTNLVSLLRAINNYGNAALTYESAE